MSQAQNSTAAPSSSSLPADPTGMPDPAEVIIEYRGVSKRFGDKVVLDDVSCRIPRGQITVIIGPSGVGKSVFIKNLVGLMRPDRGEILVDGEDVCRMGRSALYRTRRKFGMMFQDGALFDSLTVGENIAFPLRRHTRKGDAEIAAIVADRLSMVGLPGIEELYPAQLSGGMRKRVSLARAIARMPEVVLFDEPNSGLDPVMADTIDKLILRLQRTLGLTFLVISHDIPSTCQIADQVGMLYNGKLVAFGPRAAVLASDDPILRQFFERRAEGPIRVA